MLVARVGKWSDRILFDIDKNVSSLRVTLRYSGASLLCHVDVIGTLPPDMRLQATIKTEGEERGGSELDANGDLLHEGMEPGRYTISIGYGSDLYTEEKSVFVKKNQRTKVTFTIDADKLQKHEN